MRKTVFLVFTLFILSSCSSISMRETPKPIEINGTTYDKYTLWECHEFYGGRKADFEFVNIPDISFEKETQEGVALQEDEALENAQKALNNAKSALANVYNDYVLFDNRKEHANAHYYRHGINQRWDWGKNKFSFVIKPDGIGLYYDFSSTEEGGATSANDLFKCNVAYE